MNSNKAELMAEKSTLKNLVTFTMVVVKKILHKPYSSDGLSWPEKSVKYLGITIPLAGC